MSQYFTGKSLLELPTDFSVMKIETTDLNPIRGRINEIAVKKYRNNKPIDTFSFEITEENIHDKLLTLDNFLGEDKIVINRAAFFCPFVGNAYVQYLHKPFNNDLIDIQRLFRAIEQENTVKLDYMIKFYGLNTSHDLKATDDIKSVKSIYTNLQKSFSKKYKDIKEIQPKGSDFALKDIPGDPLKNDKSNFFYNKYVAATGELNAYTRKEVGQIINDIGGHFQKNPGNKTNYLILGYLKNKSNKLKKAERLPDLKILSEDEFLNMISSYEYR